MSFAIRPMSIDDYAPVVALWRRSEGIGLNESDSEEAVRAFLERNPGMSPLATSASGELLGAVLCGHDGRRGYLHHLAVEPAARNRGIASALLGWCFERLAAARIPKCNVFLYSDNLKGAAFWQHSGWSPRADLRVFQKPIG